MSKPLIGSDADQVSTNGMHGTMARQSHDAVNITGGKIGDKEVGEATKAVEVAFDKTGTGLDAAHVQAALVEIYTQATETKRGSSRKATTVEARERTNDEAYLTALKLQQAMNATGTAPLFGVRAWVHFDGATGAITAGGNVESVTRFSVGSYRINFATPMPHANFSVSGSVGRNSGGFGAYLTRAEKHSDWVNIEVWNYQGSPVDAPFTDIQIVC